jgi:MoxR-like ATPase
LPEAQLDRFFLKTALGYPDANAEQRILAEQRHGHPLRLLEPVLSVEEVQGLRSAAQEVYVDELLQRWIVDLVRATREQDVVTIGASVRGSLALERAARAWALLSDRSFVLPGDVERLFAPVLMHRIVFRPALVAEARRNGWPAATEAFKQACLAEAPRPEAAPDGGVVPLGERR